MSRRGGRTAASIEMLVLMASYAAAVIVIWIRIEFPVEYFHEAPYGVSREGDAKRYNDRAGAL